MAHQILLSLARTEQRCSSAPLSDRRLPAREQGRVNSVAAPEESLPWFDTSGCARGCRPSERRPGRPRPAKRVFFASAHSIVDFSNGASVATLDVLQGLTTAGFECQAFCAAKLDFQTEVCLESIVDSMHEPRQTHRSICGSRAARVLYTRRGHVPITIIRLESTRHGVQRHDEVQTVLEFFEKFLEVYRPDVMLTYGGDPTTAGMIARAKQRGIPVVFALHNFAYTNPRFFANVDYCLVASEFARRHYRDKVGLDCRALSYPLDWDRVYVESPEPRLSHSSTRASRKESTRSPASPTSWAGRPDIPLMVVESRGTRNARCLLTGPGSRRQHSDHDPHHRPAPVLGADENRSHAFALVGKPAARGLRGHDQRNPRHRLEPWRHSGNGRERRHCAPAAGATDDGDHDRARGLRGRALGRDHHPPVG